MNIEERPAKKSPEESANIFNVLFFWWTKDIFRKGIKKNLTLDDIYDPLKSNESERLAEILEREWYHELEKFKEVKYTLKGDGIIEFIKNTEPSLYKAIVRAFWKKYLVIGIFLFVHSVLLSTLQPILQGYIIDYFDIKTNSKGIGRNEALGYAFGLIFNILLSVIILHNVNLRCQEIGMRVRVACTSLIYRKILRLSKTTLTQTTSTGQIINILSNDMSRFDTISSLLHYIWIAPIQFILVTYIMYMLIGLPTFIGVLTLFVIVFSTQTLFPIISKRLRASIASLTDRRVQLMSELINGIQVIKMYAWEKSFGKLVSETRRAEITKVKLSAFIQVTYIAIAVFTERLILYLSVVSFALTNNILDAQNTYILATFFNIMQLMIAIYFPQALLTFKETEITVKRIEDFLLLDEAIMCDRPIFLPAKSNKKEINGLQNRKKEEMVTRIEPENPASVELIKASANWLPQTLPPTLCNINIKVEAGQLCILLGQVGAGKTALLHVLLRELPLGAGTMKILQNSLAEIKNRKEQKYITDNPNIRISYASQEPWLFGGTIRQNILFSEPYNKERYMDVTRVCALNKDFQQLPQGDLTVVGEKGVMLSGGQKARVNLARAIYKQAEIYLLDDPLSAVDTKVAKHIFKKCIEEYLKDKTRILATHQLQFLKSANIIVVLNHGTVKLKGSYRELFEYNEEFMKMITSIETVKEQTEYHGETNEKQIRSNGESVTNTMSNRSYDSSGSNIGEPKIDDHRTTDNDVQDETKLTGDISSKLYAQFFKHGGSWCTLSVLAVLMILGQVATSGNDYWLAYWTNIEAVRSVKNQSSIMNIESNYNMINNTFFAKFLALDDAGLLTTKSAMFIQTFCILSCIVLVLARSFFYIRICMKASCNIHDTMFNNVLQANMHFFHINSSGRILNRFSKDVGAMDELLPRPMLETLQVLLVVIGIIFMELITNYWIIFPLIALSISVYFVRRLYITTAGCIKRFEGVYRSPIYSHVSTTLSGLSTIRSSGKETQNLLRKEFDRLQDKHTGTWYLLLVSSAVLGFLLDIFSCLFIVFITLFFILEDKDKLLGGNVGLAISQALIIINTLQYGIKQSVETFTHMSSVERIFQYMDLPKESLLTKGCSPPPTWPSQGRLVLDNVSMKYSQDESPVLKNLSVTIEAGWKVGVVGRTGAGKSSLISALFRLFADGLEGEIKIDGIDTSTIDLLELRSRISIIPQEPILFAASLRYNLDPFNQYDDAALWNVLGEVELTSIGLEQKIVTNGSNLSIGQRQLICLARAMLRKNRIIILDEATANIDSHTDELIQRTLRTKFRDCTVLTIAHRLNTIIDSHRILVMDAGQIVEFGSPFELLCDKPNGYFAQMVQNTGSVMSKNLLQQAENAYFQNSA